MSIKNVHHASGHATKRRKLSHSSNDDDRNSSPVRDDFTDNGNGLDNESPSSEDDMDAETSVRRPSLKESTQRRASHSNAASTTTVSTAASSITSMLQVASLLQGIKPDHASRLKKLKPHISRITDAIKSVSGQQPMPLKEAQAFAKKSLGVAIPWNPQPDSGIQYSFSFAKPSKITIGGPLIHHLSLRGYATIQVVPEMPHELFQEKDYLNWRAIHKRAFYLACIASTVKLQLGSDYDIQYAYCEDNSLVPVLTLKPRNGHATVDNALFVINPSLPDSLGSVEKMLPGQKSLRKETVTSKPESNVPDLDLVYNSTVRALCSVTMISDLLDTTAKNAENFLDACLLGAVWLRQRGFDSSWKTGGFGIEEWSIVCALLLESGGHQGRPLFSPRYSAIQLFKAMLQVLSSRDMLDPFVLRGAYQLEKSDRPILLDAITGVNVLFKMTPWSYARLKDFAATSLTAINSRKVGGYEATFISKVADPVLQYDEVYEVLLGSASSHGTQEQLYKILKRGLGDRCSSIDLKSSPREPWKLSLPSSPDEKLKITIGLLTNPEAAARLVDHGPSVEEKEESKSFRNFWGDKAELRRFKDGRISESLVWSAEMPATGQIIQFLCSKHLKLQPSLIRSTPALPTIELPSNLSITADEVFTAINSRFQSLSSTLHHLTGIPLPVRSVTPASAALRSTSLVLPLEATGSSQPISVLIQFDTSGRWPDHLPAIQYTKIAFLTKLSDLLTSSDKTLTTRLGLENTQTSHLGIHNTSFLDITYHSQTPLTPPTIFRLRIHHDRDLHLIQQALTSKTTPLIPRLRETYQAALITHRRTFHATPTHTSAIRTLITIFPPLSTTIRLLKRWVSTHHLSNHIPESVLEILAAHTFLSPHPWTTPGTATTAFARTLHFLSRWSWTTDPLLIDLSPAQDMTLDARTELTTRFAAWRKIDPNMNSVSWFIGTNIDPTGVAWTQSENKEQQPHPPRVIASRITALATAAVNIMKHEDAETQRIPRTIMTAESWKSIFTSPLTDFDFVLHLSPTLISRNTQKTKNQKQTYKNLEIAATLDVDTTGIDTVESYLEDLETCFGSAALFMYGGGGGSGSGSGVIGGLWRPHLRGEKVWKIRLGFSTVPVPVVDNVGGRGGDDGEEVKEGRAEANFVGMLAEMRIMGEGVVERISTREEMVAAWKL